MTDSNNLLEVPIRQINVWVNDFDLNNPKFPTSISTVSGEVVGVIVGVKDDFCLVKADQEFSSKHGYSLVKSVPEIANLARQSAINDMCQGEADTDFHRALANVFLDFQERKISKAKYDELVEGRNNPS